MEIAVLPSAIVGSGRLVVAQCLEAAGGGVGEGALAEVIRCSFCTRGQYRCCNPREVTITEVREPVPLRPEGDAWPK
jgi:hypothetical protein